MRVQEEGKDRPHRAFIEYLQGLDDRGDRGALAALRRGLGRDVPPAEFLRVVTPWCGDMADWRRGVHYIVAALFAIHPQSGGSGNLGGTFSRVHQKLGGRESTERRFVALLNSHQHDLPHRLRQVVSQARAAEVPIDWERLLDDITRWTYERRPTQQAWARAFWARGIDGDEESEPESSSEKGA